MRIKPINKGNLGCHARVRIPSLRFSDSKKRGIYRIFGVFYFKDSQKGIKQGIKIEQLFIIIRKE